MIQTQKIYLASPRGFCAGVERAIKVVNKAIEQFGTPIYVNHEIVHNQYIVNNFKKQDVIFTDNLKEVPENSVFIFSAHGVSPQFRKKAEAKNLKIIDATCPLVTKVHWEARKFNEENQKIFYIGQKKHQEFLGVSGVGNLELLEKIEDAQKINSKDYENQKVVCLSQTTLSINDTGEILQTLKQKIPHLKIPGDICYATTNRQKAVEALAKVCDFILVIGSKNSSNSNKLVTVAKKFGCEAQLFENAEAIPPEIFKYENIGLTSGASVPEVLVQEVVKLFKGKIKNLEIEAVKTFDETVEFQLPKEFFKKIRQTLNRCLTCSHKKHNL